MNGIKKSSQINKLLFLCFAVTAMTVVFVTFYFTESPWDSPSFQIDSELYVSRKINTDISLLDDFKYKGGFLYADIGNKFRIIPGLYTSQVGLQGLILNSVQELLKTDNTEFLGYSRIFVSLLLAITLSVILYTAWVEFGWITSVTFFLLIISAFWIVAFSKNLYWVEFTLFLPFAAGWLIYPKVLRSKIPFAGYLFVTGVLILLKSLNGYEYLTNVILGASIGPIYYELGSGRKLKELTKRIVLIIFAGVVGFSIAYGLHFVQLYAYTQDLQRSFYIITERAITRTIGENPYTTGCDSSYYPIVILKYLNSQSLLRADIPLVWIFSVFTIGIVPIIPFRFNKGISLIIIITSIVMIVVAFGVDIYLGKTGLGISQILLLSAGVTFLLFGFLSLTKTTPVKSEKLIRLALTTTWALISSFSWVILAKNHMACHLHINSIVFYLPYGITLFLFISYWLETLINNRSTRKSSWTSSK
jgi:hypothetical protein